MIARTVIVAALAAFSCGSRAGDHRPGTASAQVIAKVCAAAPCSGPRASVEVWRDKTGAVALYVHQGDLQRCSHPPTVWFDPSGKELLTQAEKPVAPGSDEARRLEEERDKLTRDRVKGESMGCAKP